MALNKDELIEEILAIVSPQGEEASGIYRWQVALVLPNVIRKMVIDIANGNYPTLGTGRDKGLAGQFSDISSLQMQLQRLYRIPILGVAGETTLAPALNDVQPMILHLPFMKVRHVLITSKLSMYVPDEDTLDELGELYGNEALVYTIDAFPFTQVGAPDEILAEGGATGGTVITTSKKMIFRPSTLTGSFEVLAYFVPTVGNLPDVFKPFVLESAVMMLMGANNGQR